MLVMATLLRRTLTFPKSELKESTSQRYSGRYIGRQAHIIAKVGSIMVYRKGKKIVALDRVNGLIQTDK